MSENEQQKPQETAEPPAAETSTPEVTETTDTLDIPDTLSAGAGTIEIETPDFAALSAEAQARIDALEAELAEAKDKMLRAVAEAENARRRARLDKEDAAKFGISGFARDLLPVADNLRRAIESVKPETVEGDESLKGFLDGVAMTERELLGAFEKNKVEKIDPLGEKLDPNLHQAMFEMPHDELETGRVGQVMAPGYSLHGRLLRPAMVGVVKNPEKPADSGDNTAPGANLDTSA